MKHIQYYGIALFLLLAVFPTYAQQPNITSLAGEWRFATDPQNAGEKDAWFTKVPEHTITLPGTTDEARYGEKTTGSDYGILTRAYKYIGPAWYQREIVIPEMSAGKDFELFIDRVMWESKVWIDGRYCGSQDGLGVPHIHRLGKLGAGKHLLTMRINNDMIHTIGDKGHAYSEYTQSIWNGAVGRIELRELGRLGIENLKIGSGVDARKLKITFDLRNETKRKSLTFNIKLTDPADGSVVATHTEKRKVADVTGSVGFTLDLPENIKAWDEFQPNLYRLMVETSDGKSVDVKTVETGFRNVSTSKSKILINNRPVFLRGNLDCVHFPITGYPSCNVADWERIFGIYKAHGLNHVRFHSWCPPEAAFVAADRLGIYLQVEILWIDWWMTSAPADRPDMLTKGLPEGLGKNPSADAYVQAEMRRIIDAYGNHPSFLMFCIGNELGNSDFEVMQQWISAMRQSDNRRLYSVSTARKITDADQYMVTHNIPGVGGTYGVRGYTTDYDLEQNYSKAGIPIIAHEVGQYPVYPLWSEIDKYTGVLKARNLELCRESARKNHLEAMDVKFQQASGALQNILYKAHIENLLRTPSCAGFQLLSMTDYQGQGEALVGWLDCFWDSKGTLKPEDFRQYCNAVVPLARFKKFVWETHESFEAHVQVANYGNYSMNSRIRWKLTSSGGKVLEQGTFDHPEITSGKLNDIGKISLNLNTIKDAGRYTFSIELENTGYRNSWNIWIYPPVVPINSNVVVAGELSADVLKKLKNGANVLLIAHKAGTSATSRPLHFTPLFWSTVFFPGQANSTLGLYLDNQHPAFRHFPTDNYSDYQWQTISEGRSFVLNDFPEIQPIAQPISDFHINDRLGSVFECKVGNGKLLVCGYHIANDTNPVARQLKYSLLNYMHSTAFSPLHEIPDTAAARLFYHIPPVVSQAPAGFADAFLYVQCGALMTGNGSKPWQHQLDQVFTKSSESAYQVTCTDVWKDEKGTAWTGNEITVRIKTPRGVIGNLYVKFVDTNQQHRRGTVWFEGREMKLGSHEEEAGKWVKIFVMREDTNDGEIVLKTKATQGGNLMISEIGFVEE